jgi:phosphomannomutase
MEPAMIHDMKEAAAISPLAGKPAPTSMLVDLARLEREYYARTPEMDDPTQVVSFGTSGHRGSPFRGSFTEAHITAITQAICDYRRGQRIDGPLYMGKDTHALSEPAQRTALEVLAANGVETIIQRDGGVTPTPVISRAILVYNRGRKDHLADGIVVTPSHNPPEDGGFKYNPPNGGPADLDVTRWVQRRANVLMGTTNAGVKRMPFATAIKAATTHEVDLVLPYVEDLEHVVDMDAIRAGGLTLAVDPLGGAATPYWEPINFRYKVNIAVVNAVLDPTFSFMTMDHDGKIRMDPSSPYAMARLIGLKDQFDVAFANDPDSDRHGIVTRSAGLMNPNHYLAVAIRYLLGHRPQWPAHAAVGKTLVSSSVIDRVVGRLGRRALRGARRLQVVRARPVRRLVLLRRRGECGRQLPAPRRHRVDDGQGRPDHGSSGGGDHGPHRQGSRRALQRAGRRVRRVSLHARRRGCHAPAKGATPATVTRGGESRDARRRTGHRQADERPREQRCDRRSEGRDGGRLVCGSALRHRKHLQDLCGELQERGAP